MTDLKLRRTPGVQAGLAAVGIAPEQITHVLMTHAHDDHFLGATVRRRDGQHIPRYPQARYVIGRAEWEGNPAREDPTSEVALRLGALDRRGLLAVVDGEDEIVPGVTLLPAPRRVTRPFHRPRRVGGRPLLLSGRPIPPYL